MNLAEALLRKTAADSITYQPNQIAAANALHGTHGIIMWHGLGSGKGLGSILASEQHGGANVITPASLQDNYKKELAKAKPKQPFSVQSYEGFTNHVPKNISERTLVIDESHRLRNPGVRSNAIAEAAARARKVVLLTGTPIQNKPHELASLVNIAAGHNVLPANEKEFNKQFLGMKSEGPGFVGWLMGRGPTQVPYLKNEKTLSRAMRGHISYYQPKPDISKYPTVTHHEVGVEMHPRQAQIHRLLYNQLSPSLRHTIRDALPPDKQDVGALNSFISAGRQISNTTEAFDREFKPEHAVKINEVARRIKNSQGPAIAYSNYIGSGISPLKKRLDSLGVSNLAFTGDISHADRRKAVDAYNSGKIKALLLSSAGGEGLDLKGTRSIHVLEHHWNAGKIDQVVGRGARFMSHSHLPEDQRKVDVFHYTAKLPEPFFGSAPRSADEYLRDLGKQKSKVNKLFLGAARRASVENQKGAV